VEIRAEGSLTLYQAHDIAQKVHDNIEHSFPRVKHCMVHVNPA
ncbi:MAG: cation transporter dimerization domain-containing protein, partial [Eubacteriales bacterium]|nr:cation transporter dimerization domain-containing protein [Eubacteriales bacterium]